jgi:hypothetical protein
MKSLLNYLFADSKTSARKSSRTLKPRRRLGLEGLEERQMMAGDMHVAYTGGGAVKIEGNYADNNVRIEALPYWPGYFGTPNLFRISGASQGGAPTTINGGSSLVVAATSFDIDMGAGNDNVTVVGTNLFPSYLNGLHIFTGTGTDYVRVESVNADSLYVLGNYTGVNDFGDKTVVVAFCNFAHSCSVETGAGSDQVTIGSTSVRDYLSINTNDGGDNVFLTRVIAGSVDVSLGKGNDLFVLGTLSANHLTCMAGEGFDTAYRSTAGGIGGTYLDSFESITFVPWA